MQCPKCQSEMWYNEPEKKSNPKQPDYKCKNKDCGHAVWNKPKQASNAPQNPSKTPVKVSTSPEKPKKANYTPDEIQAFKDKERRICRESVLKCAVEIAIARQLPDIGTITDMAAMLEEWVYRETDTKTEDTEETLAEKQFSAFAKMLEDFEAAKKEYGEDIYYDVLRQFNFEHSNNIPSVKAGKTILSVMATEWELRNK